PRPRSTLFPYTTLFRSAGPRLRGGPGRLIPRKGRAREDVDACVETVSLAQLLRYVVAHQGFATRPRAARNDDVATAIRRLGCVRSEEHTSELQSPCNLV